MAKIKNIIIIDNKLLQLNEDAKSGDIIDLEEINQVDLSLISDKIKKAYEEEFQTKLRDERVKFEQEKKSALLEKELESAKRLQEKEEVNVKLQAKIDTLTKQLDDEVRIKTLEYKEEYQEKLHDLEIKLQDANNALLLSKAESNALIDKKDQEIRKLVHEKSALSVKKIGERLELWCNEEYAAYAQTGFVNCTWEKDNDSKKEDGEQKGTKADFIFKVYANETFDENNLLTSAILEMKSEAPDSVNKKKNADHIDKLDKDRKKKGCEYAILVSELEWDNDNDVPIKKVTKYDKMYIVRPNYFIPLLSIIEGLGKKYQGLLLKQNEEVIKFKDSQEIINEFDKFKEDLIGKFVEKIQKDMEIIVKQAEAISASSSKILDTCEDMKNKLVKNCLNKIEKLDITKLIKKIEKI